MGRRAFFRLKKRVSSLCKLVVLSKRRKKKRKRSCLENAPFLVEGKKPHPNIAD